jgi:hypothetical protein
MDSNHSVANGRNHCFPGRAGMGPASTGRLTRGSSLNERESSVFTALLDTAFFVMAGAKAKGSRAKTVLCGHISADK